MLKTIYLLSHVENNLLFEDYILYVTHIVDTMYDAHNYIIILPWAF